MWAYIIICIFCIHLYWYLRQIRKTGIIVDWWLINIVTSSIIWCFLLYPVAGSELNIMSVGKHIYDIQKHVDEAFIYVVIGYCSMWVGKYLSDRKYAACPTPNTIERHMMLIYNSAGPRNIILLVYLPFIIITSILGAKNFGSDLRLVMNIQGVTRIIYNISYTASPTLFAIFAFLWIEYKKKIYMLWAIFFIISTFLLSVRGLLFGNLVIFIVFWAIKKGRQVSYKKMLLLGMILIVGIFFMGAIRSSSTASFGADFLNNFRYGNTFCDLRDFAWILSGWNGDYLFGKTYLAGLISFIPSSYSTFRTEWGMGHVSLRLAGLNLDPDQFHGGIRGSIFVESLLNFGIIGMILCSVLYGYIMNNVSKKVTYYVRAGRYLRAYVSIKVSMFISLLMISSASFTVYVLFLPILVLYPFLKKK